jgi:hypothetical protein
MKKYTDSTLFLIVVSLIIAAVLNFLLGAVPGLSSDKTATQVNFSSVQETTPASKAAAFTVQEPATDSQQSIEKLQPGPAPAPTSESIHTSTPRAVPTEDYQDAQWIANVQKHLGLLSNDAEEVGNTTSNLDSDMLATYGQYLIDDTQTATEENKQYMVSPKCQDARKEWELALQDYSSAGELMIKASEEGKSNDTNGDDVNQALYLIDSGSGHLNSVNEFLETSA